MPPKKKADPGPPPKKSKISDFFGSGASASSSAGPSNSTASPQVSLHVLPGYEKEAKDLLTTIPSNLDVVITGADKLDTVSEDTIEGDPLPSSQEEDITPIFTVEFQPPPTNYKSGKRQPLHEAYEITNYLEEGLFATGLDLMRETAVNNVKTDMNGNKKVKELHIPTCQQLQIALTILVHPDFTTSVRPWEYKKAKDYRAAVKALKAIQKNFSPADLRMEEVVKCRIEYASKLGAMAAKKARESNLEKNGNGEAGKTGMSEIFDGEEVCDSIYCQDECVFNQGGDMWELIGWMMSCSVKKRKRWEYWRKLADIIVRTWEIDWWRCVNRKDGFEMKESIFINNLPASGPIGFKRCVKAAWARGEKDWRPWFENETKRYRKRQWQPWEVTPLKEEMDLMDPDEELSDDEVDPEDDGLLDPAAGLGGKEAVDLRCRLMALIASTSDYGFFGNGQTIAVFEEIRDFYSDLRFAQFHYMISSSEITTEAQFRSALNLLMIEDYLSTDSYFYTVSEKAKKKRKDSPEAKEAEYMHSPFEICQRKVELCFAPYPAITSSILENAKMNILVEQLIHSLIEQNLFKYDPSFEDAVYTGIQARREAITGNDKLSKIKKKQLEREDPKAIELINAISELNMRILMKERRQMVLNHHPEDVAGYTAAEFTAIAKKNTAMAESDATLEQSLEDAQQALEEYKVYRRENQKEILAKKEADKAARRQQQIDRRKERAVKKLKAEKAIDSEEEVLLLSPRKKRGRKPKVGKKPTPVPEFVFDDIPRINPTFRYTDEDLDHYSEEEVLIDPFTGDIIPKGGLLKKVPIDPSKDKQGDTIMDPEDEEADVSRFGLKVPNSDEEEGDSDDDLEYTKEEKKFMELKAKHNKDLKNVFDGESELSSLSSEEDEELEEGMLDTATLLKAIKEGGKILTK
ncbi:hypothetical protein BJ508DRAFT_372540 [Ascobolus immersus RN42]|uniref:Uncharacterized protein n=1 Tax=Ascobolus immersus RN42 TaxID=1160509 RepID=A0A3N4ILP3_ASCIM|nr:hypothetical protein BJ508DRAFT_372540 [Ascobolus immersus RN42]